METTAPFIQITDAAAGRLKEVAANENVNMDEAYIRVAVVEGGCSGLTYDLGWDTVKADSDTELQEHGLRIIMDRRSYLYLEGTTLDFSDGLEGKGFHFHNPQASRTCACGESFSL